MFESFNSHIFSNKCTIVKKDVKIAKKSVFFFKIRQKTYLFENTFNVKIYTVLEKEQDRNQLDIASTAKV